MILDEIFESNFVIEEPTEKTFIAELKNISFAKADWKNGNDRIYPKTVLKTAVEALNSKLSKGFVAGYPGHVSGEVGAVADISHILRRVTVDETGLAKADIGILSTTKGKDLLKLLKAGLSFGLSMRGYGELDSDKKIKPGYKLKTVDVVEQPSFQNFARLDSTNVYESLLPEEEEKNVIDEDKFALMLTKMLETGFDRVGENYSDFESFVDSSFDLYKKTLVKHILEEGFSLPWISEEEVQIEEAEKKEENKLRNFYAEAIEAGTNLSFDEWQKAYEKTENRNVVEHEKLYSLFEEYQISGGNLPFEEWKKLYK